MVDICRPMCAVFAGVHTLQIQVYISHFFFLLAVFLRESKTLFTKDDLLCTYTGVQECVNRIRFSLFMLLLQDNVYRRSSHHHHHMHMLIMCRYSFKRENGSWCLVSLHNLQELPTVDLIRRWTLLLFYTQTRAWRNGPSECVTLTNIISIRTHCS